MPEARIRANHSKHLISRIKVLPEPDRTRILQRIDGVRARVREASVFDWLPARFHTELVAGITEMLPPVRALAFFKNLMADAFGKALLRPLVQGAIAIHGRDPKSLLRMAPRTWSLVSKDAGSFAVDLERGDGEAVGTMTDMPPVIAKSSGMLQFFEAGMCSCVEHFGGTPIVRMDISKLTRGELRLDIAWDPMP